MMYTGQADLWLEDRFRQHLNYISKAHKPVSQHYNQWAHKDKRDISVTAINSCSSNESVRKALEQRLIFETGCLHSAALNFRYSFLWITLSFIRL